MTFLPQTQQVYLYLLSSGRAALGPPHAPSALGHLSHWAAFAVCGSLQVDSAETFQSLSSFNFVWVLCFTTSPSLFLFSLSLELTNEEKCMPTCKPADAAAEPWWSCLHGCWLTGSRAALELGSIYQLWTEVTTWFAEGNLAQGSAHFVWRATK